MSAKCLGRGVVQGWSSGESTRLPPLPVTNIDPSKIFIDFLTLKVIWNIDRVNMVTWSFLSLLPVSLKVCPVDEDDEPVPPPTTQKIVPRVQVVQQQAPPQQRQPVPQSQSSQVQQISTRPVVTQATQAPPQQRQPVPQSLPSQVQQISTRPVAQQATQTVNVEGEARVRYNFKAETQRELPCSKVRSRLYFLFVFLSILKATTAQRAVV